MVQRLDTPTWVLKVLMVSTAASYDMGIEANPLACCIALLTIIVQDDHTAERSSNNPPDRRVKALLPCFNLFDGGQLCLIAFPSKAKGRTIGLLSTGCRGTFLVIERQDRQLQTKRIKRGYKGWLRKRNHDCAFLSGSSTRLLLTDIG